jgi:hypothetical protein
MRTITASVQLEKITGRESQLTCRDDELIGAKPPVVKKLSTLAFSVQLRELDQSSFENSERPYRTATMRERIGIGELGTVRLHGDVK